MGWNRGYTIYEHQVVGLYDLGVLTEPVLKVILDPFRGTDMDHGGERGLQSKDGLSADEIVVKTARPGFYVTFVEKRAQMLKAFGGQDGLNAMFKSEEGILSPEVTAWEELHDEFLDVWTEITETC